MNLFIYNFLFVPSLTVEFGVAVLTAVFTILTLSIFGVNASELSSLFSEKLIVLGTLLLLLLTWAMAVVGASMRSRKLITFTIVLWIIFIIMWLVLSLFFRVIKKNTQYCVANKCAPSMWLIGNGAVSNEDGESTDSDDPDDPDDPDDSNEPESLKHRRRLWLKDGPSKANVMSTPVADTVESNQTSMMIGVNNNGWGHQRTTTTESPPNDMITRVKEYRKNMTMYHQFAEAVKRQRKKKGKKKNVDDDDAPEDEEDGGDEDESEDGASIPTLDLLLMSVFLLLYLYALNVLFSYHSELKLMSICNCDVNLRSPRTKTP
ncbi:hypothetical protein ACI65C_004669 [Semiaphis heraclei]